MLPTGSAGESAFCVNWKIGFEGSAIERPLFSFSSSGKTLASGRSSSWPWDPFCATSVRYFTVDSTTMTPVLFITCLIKTGYVMRPCSLREYCTTVCVGVRCSFGRGDFQGATETAGRKMSAGVHIGFYLHFLLMAVRMWNTSSFGLPPMRTRDVA